MADAADNRASQAGYPYHNVSPAGDSILEVFVLRGKYSNETLLPSDVSFVSLRGST